MDDAALRAYIVKRLAQSAQPAEIALELADKEHIYYDDALKLVETVRGDSTREVEMRHAPLVFAMSAVMFVLGCGITLAAIASVMGILFGLTAISVIGPLNAANALIYMTNFGGLILAQAVLGMAMIAGGSVGLRRLWGTVIQK